MRLMRIWCTAECAAIVSARLWRADGSKKNRVVGPRWEGKGSRAIRRAWEVAEEMVGQGSC